ncbi:MAG: sulfotransferase family protein, partial [Actinomyces sp.]
GTLSLKAALEQLGFGPCHHMIEVIGAPTQADVFVAAHRGETVDWDTVYGPYAATVDFPGCVFWRQLADRHPDAKVVLSVRPAADWYASCRATIFAGLEVDPADPSLDEDGRRLARLAEVIRRGVFDDRLDDAEHCMAVFEAHNAAVRREVPPERLVEVEVGAGWEPLCAGLGVAVPDVPYPRTNTRAEFRDAMGEGRRA